MSTNIYNFDFSTYKHNKIFVLDTNVIIFNPDCLTSFDTSQVVIPMVVLDELDKFKQGSTPQARNVREAIRFLDDYFQNIGENNLKYNIHIKHSGEFNLEAAYTQSSDVPYFMTKFLGDSADDQILKTCLQIASHNPDKKVILVTKDIKLRVKARTYSVTTVDFSEERLPWSELFDGTEQITLTQKLFNSLFKYSELAIDKLTEDTQIAIKEYPWLNLTVINASNPDKTGLAYVCDDKIKTLNASGVKTLSPRNREQRFALNLLLNTDLPLVTMTGPAGVGKTLLAVACGLDLVERGVYDRVIVSRPIQPLGKDLGFLPGDVADKLDPWMTPIKDAVSCICKGGKSMFSEFIDMGMLEVEPLTYIRGRSIPKSFFILDEAQNLSRHEIKTILSRIGQGSKVVLTGDIFQIDNPYLSTISNGLTQVVEKFKGEQIAGHISLTKGERSELATKASQIL